MNRGMFVDILVNESSDASSCKIGWRDSFLILLISLDFSSETTLGIRKLTLLIPKRIF